MKFDQSVSRWGEGQRDGKRAQGLRPSRRTSSLEGRPGIVNRRGFTLLELLASIAILGIIVMMMTAIFAESDKAWNLGTGRAVNNTEARAALALMARDMEVAVADQILTFLMRPDKNNLITYGFANSEINLVSLRNDSSDGNRTAREIQYWLNQDPVVTGRYQLVRSAVSDALVTDPLNHCYHNPTWFTNRASGSSYGVVADNVVGLTLLAPTSANRADWTRTWYAGWTNNVLSLDGQNYSNMTNLPPFVDIYLEIMNERQSRQLYDLKERFGVGSPQVLDFAERNAFRHTTRVFFQNRQGYAGR